MTDGIIPCKHDLPKSKLRVNYDGEEKILDACNDCVEIIKLSSICKILEILP